MNLNIIIYYHQSSKFKSIESFSLCHLKKQFVSKSGRLTLPSLPLIVQFLSPNCDFFSPSIQVSHDFAVNFDEDNPECAGESSKCT